MVRERPGGPLLPGLGREVDPGRAIIVLVLATGVATLVVAGSPLPLLARLAILLAVGTVGSFAVARLVGQVRDQLEQAQATSVRANHRARLARATTDAARTLTHLDAGDVLRSLLEAVVDLGFTGVWLCELDEGAGVVRVVDQVGLQLPPGTVLPPGVAHLALGRHETVVVHDVAASPDQHGAVAVAGIETLVATPVELGAGADTVLVVGTRRGGRIDAAEQDAIEALALHAALALRTARQHETAAVAHELRERELELRRDHLATAAHELRTPLTVVHGAVSLLRTRGREMGDELRDQLLDRVFHHSNDLVRLVERLHRLDELHRGVTRARPEPVGLQELVARVITTANRRSHHHLMTHHVPTGTVVRCDPGLMIHVIHELLDNVLTHTPPLTHVHIGAEPVEGGVRLLVADDGPGIDADALDVITQTFGRIGDHHHRTSRGIGIGLDLADRLVRLHDSRLRLESGPNGTTASFDLVATDEEPHVDWTHVRLDALTTSRTGALRPTGARA